MRRIVLLLLAVCLVFSCNREARVITINEESFPDELFRKAICTYFEKEEGDTLHQKTLLATEELDLSKLGLSSLRGIEFFPNLTTLDCSENLLSEVDLSANTALRKLELYGNQLVSLDVSGNPQLYALGCSHNRLESLDVTGNPGLKELLCNGNPLESIDLSNNPKLEKLGVNNCRLLSLDVSNNPELTNLYCDRNRFSELDLSNNSKLNNLVCDQPFLGRIHIIQPEGNFPQSRHNIWTDQLVKMWFDKEMEARHNALLQETAFTPVIDNYPVDSLEFATALGEMDAYIEAIKAIQIKTIADTVKFQSVIEKMDGWKDNPTVLYFPDKHKNALTPEQENHLQSTIQNLKSELVRVSFELEKTGYRIDHSDFLML